MDGSRGGGLQVRGGGMEGVYGKGVHAPRVCMGTLGGGCNGMQGGVGRQCLGKWERMWTAQCQHLVNSNLLYSLPFTVSKTSLSFETYGLMPIKTTLNTITFYSKRGI